jgi:hypothetical protein
LDCKHLHVVLIAELFLEWGLGKSSKNVIWDSSHNIQTQKVPQAIQYIVGGEQKTVVKAFNNEVDKEFRKSTENRSVGVLEFPWMVDCKLHHIEALVDVVSQGIMK